MSPKVYLILPCETCGKNYNAAGPVDRLVCCGRPMRYKPADVEPENLRAVMAVACKAAESGQRVVKLAGAPNNVIEGGGSAPI